MTKEIKFRAWDKQRNSMITSKHWHVSFDGNICPSGREEYDYNGFELMQYTGLKDKDGRKIYEGDIVEIISPIDGRGRMEIKIPDCYEWQLNPQKNILKVEIIGNIYKNPDLLK